MINVFTAEAKINETGPEHMQGLDRFEARKRSLPHSKISACWLRLKRQHTVPMATDQV